MPRISIDYSKTIIYKICCKDVNITDIYVGHSTDLIRRRQQHKQNCYNETDKEYNVYKYQFIRENGGWENWSLIPIEEFPCENVNQARIRERYWIETLKATLNKQIPTRTNKEYYEDNKEHIKEVIKEWYEDNKEYLKEYRKEWYNNNKEHKKEYREDNLDKIKEYIQKWREDNKEHLKEIKKKYYENNKEKNKEKVKEYRENNKEKIKEKKQEKFTCECGGCYTNQHKSRHLKTQKHQNYLSTQTIPA